MPCLFVERGFEQSGALYCVKSKYREGVEFINQDLRSEMPVHRFDLNLCRYVAFTYFAAALKRRVIAGMLERLRPNGYFVIGAEEELPGVVPGLVSLNGEPHIFQKTAGRNSSAAGHFDITEAILLQKWTLWGLAAH